MLIIKIKTMEKINVLTTILLKLVIIVCFAFVTFYYCMNAGNNRYKVANNDSLVLAFDGKTGEHHVSHH